MHIINGIAYAEDRKAPIRVKSIRALDGYKLWVRFMNDEIKVFDFTPLLGAPCYRPLKNKEFFNKVYVEYGCAVWDDGNIDIATERLYYDGVALTNAESA